jgi:hypothetical protein
MRLMPTVLFAFGLLPDICLRHRGELTCFREVDHLSGVRFSPFFSLGPFEKCGQFFAVTDIANFICEQFQSAFRIWTGPPAAQLIVVSCVPIPTWITFFVRP